MSQLQIVSWDASIWKNSCAYAILCKTILSKRQCIHAKGTTDKAMRQTSQAHIYSTLPLERRCEFVQMYMYMSIMWCICSVHCCYRIVKFLLIISILHHCQSQWGYTKYNTVILRSLTHTHNKKLTLTPKGSQSCSPLIILTHSQLASWLASPF